MGNAPSRSTTSFDASSTFSQDSHSTVTTLQEPFLDLTINSSLTFENKSTIYRSLVALVKVEYPFDIELQDRAVRFLKILEPWCDREYTSKLITELVPSSAGSPDGFVESINKLKQQHPKSLHITESDLIAKVLTTLQPHTLQFSGNEEIIRHLITIITYCVDLASASSLSGLGITDAADTFSLREMILRKVALPSSQFVTFLIVNRHNFNGGLAITYMHLLHILIQISLFHRPTLEFVVASPIVMGFSSSLSFIENDLVLWSPLMDINHSLKEWKNEGPEVAQTARRIIQALFSEGFEDTLEQTLKHDRDGDHGRSVVYMSHTISKSLGSNVTRL
ncbi:hypothetical protein BLNAU_9504 [Blattamonas nauphoetae]|uniref:Uncharacterized protein n=1 Tax=Blattamonas nauphoetae TaxID=2049346 RepID=A0ABQ9XVE0_9EUKA|nr:hypothetical protein BLNAU_9504 [Blattamonas nauphoetae]